MPGLHPLCPTAPAVWSCQQAGVQNDVKLSKESPVIGSGKRRSSCSFVWEGVGFGCLLPKSGVNTGVIIE